MKSNFYVASSFRDPSGSLFFDNGILLRRVNNLYKNNYELLMNSDLYKILVQKKLLISHKEIVFKKKGKEVYKLIQPQFIPFISYPYEWCFSQLKDAALLTLKIQKISLKYGMTLKDSNAWNIQFFRGKAIFIDTLSFEKYKEGSPWIAYKQFCQHFLAPLLLMAKKNTQLNQISKIFLDGIPLSLTSSLLPKRTYLNFSILSHIHLHAQSQKYFGKKSFDFKRSIFNLNSMLGLINNLESLIYNLKLSRQDTEWVNYYSNTNYSSTAFKHKKMIVSEFLKIAKPKKCVWDLGANEGVFSRLASEQRINTISFDIDLLAVEKNYLKAKLDSDKYLLPLIIDLTNPSPAIGWENNERYSLIERGPADCVLALALIHHLAISNNLPFVKIAEFFRKICQWLIIEFVPKNDSNVKILLSSREDIFSDYLQENFETEFSKYFKIINRKNIINSKRVMYLMKNLN